MAESHLEEKMREIVHADPRYSIEAYQFIFDVLDYTIVKFGRHRKCGLDRHISVRELLDGVQEFSVHEYGPLAGIVLEYWGLFRTEDIGEVVFNLIEFGLLNRREEDCKADFENGFSFRDAFAVQPEICWEQLA